MRVVAAALHLALAEDTADPTRLSLIALARLAAAMPELAAMAAARKLVSASAPVLLRLMALPADARHGAIAAYRRGAGPLSVDSVEAPHARGEIAAILACIAAQDEATVECESASIGVAVMLRVLGDVDLAGALARARASAPSLPEHPGLIAAALLCAWAGPAAMQQDGRLDAGLALLLGDDVPHTIGELGAALAHIDGLALKALTGIVEQTVAMQHRGTTAAPCDVAALAGPPALHLPPEIGELAALLLKHWSRWLQGFEHSSPQWLLERCSPPRRPRRRRWRASLHHVVAASARCRAAPGRLPRSVRATALAALAAGDLSFEGLTRMRISRLQVVDTAAPQAPAVDVYLAGCLARVERLLRARALLWRSTLAQFKPDHLWGVPQVPHGEIDARLACPPIGIDPAEPLPESAQQELKAASDMTATLSTLRAGKINSPLRAAEESFGLLPAERDLLLLAALPEFDPRYRRLIGYLMDDAMLAWPTAEFARACLAPLHDDIGPLLTPDATLFAGGLIETLAPSSSTGPRSQRGLKACVEIVDWLRGGDGIDRELLSGAEVRGMEKGDPVPHGILEVAGLMRDTPRLLVLAHGPGAVDPHPVRQLASAAGLALLSCPAAATLDDAKLRAIARSARLNRALLHLPLAVTSDAHPHAGQLGELLARHPGPVVLTAAKPFPVLEGWPRTGVELCLVLPDFTQRCSFWTRLLQSRALVNGHKLPALVGMLAERYRLSYSAMETAFAQADAMARMRGPRNMKLDPE